MKNRFGYTGDEWNAAKEEIRVILIVTAKAQDTIAYSDLGKKVNTMEIRERGLVISSILDEVSSDEDAGGRGLLTVVVVHKYGDMEPGPGSFDLAESLGRDVSNVTKCWIDELKKVHACWRAH